MGDALEQTGRRFVARIVVGEGLDGDRAGSYRYGAAVAGGRRMTSMTNGAKTSIGSIHLFEEAKC
jgi:hypothetical protein